MHRKCTLTECKVCPAHSATFPPAQQATQSWGCMRVLPSTVSYPSTQAGYSPLKTRTRGTSSAFHIQGGSDNTAVLFHALIIIIIVQIRNRAIKTINPVPASHITPQTSLRAGRQLPKPIVAGRSGVAVSCNHLGKKLARRVPQFVQQPEWKLGFLVAVRAQSCNSTLNVRVLYTSLSSTPALLFSSALRRCRFSWAA